MTSIMQRSKLPKGQKVLLSFSGGADSLVLLDALLKDNNTVYTVYLAGGQGPRKIWAENFHRQRALKLLKEKYPDHLMSDVTVYLDVKYRVGCEAKREMAVAKAFFAQPIDWVYGMVQAARCFPVEFDKVALGYLSTDQFSPHAEDFALAFEKMYSFTVPAEESPMVIFPLLHHLKSDIIKYLKNNNMLHLAWYCELPEVESHNVISFHGESIIEEPKACGSCPACKTHYFAALRERFEHTGTHHIEEAIAARHAVIDRMNEITCEETTIVATTDIPKDTTICEGES